MKKSRFSAATLERVLIIGIIPLIAASGFIVYSLFGILEGKAKKANHASIDSEVGTSNIKQLQELEASLAKNKDVAARALSIVADSRQYSYQDQIVNDINTFAKAAGVTILGFDFSEAGGDAAATTTEGSSSAASGAQAAPAPAESGATPAPAPAPGLKTVNASIQLDSPIPLTNFLIFLKYIEQNVTKMQVTNVTLTPDGANSTLVSNPTINITVYTR